MTLPPDFGRRFFAAAALVFGFVALAAPDYYDWLQLPWPPGIVHAYGTTVSLLEIAGAAALLFRRTSRAGALALGAVYLSMALLTGSQIAATPRAFYCYGNFFNVFVLFAGAALVYARTSPRLPPATLQRVARATLAACAVSFTLYQALYLDNTTKLVPVWIPPGQAFWAITTTVLLGFVPFGLALRRTALLATQLLALMMLSFGVLVWVPLVVSDVHTHFNWTEGIWTIAIAGAIAVFADVLADGRRAAA